MNYTDSMKEKKTSILAVYEILKIHSDEDHIINCGFIMEKLKGIYDIALDRRTIYKNIEMLIEYGYDISTYEENKKGYFLRKRQFEKSEVFLLCNVIHSSNLIPQHNSKELIDKILDSQNEYVKSDFRNQVYIDNTDKKENKEFFYTIEILSEAIKNHKVINFDYVKYNHELKLVKRRDEKYYLSPYYLVYMNERTYLIGKSANHHGLVHYRIDKIKNIEIDEEGLYLKPDHNQDPYIYAKNKMYMYGGDELTVALLCDYQILDDMVDIFGKNITIIEKDPEHFIIRVNSTMQGMLYLSLQYLEHMEVLEPNDLKVKIIDTLNRGLNRYNEN